eukprot:Colp12_sorted_trinity150504_noHs@6059
MAEKSSAMEVDGPVGEENVICCLMDNGVRCKRTASTAAYSKRVQRAVMQRKLKLVVDSSCDHQRICHHHKSIIASHRKKDKEKEKAKEEEKEPEIDFTTLHVSVLKRYKRHFKLATRHNMNKVELVQAVAKHFKALELPEPDTLATFIQMVKSGSNKLDNKVAAATE